MTVRRVHRRAGASLLKALIALAVFAVVIWFLLPLTRSSRTIVRRVQCSMNLKRIGLALAQYTERYSVLPPAYTVDAQGRPLHSWRTLLLPFLEKQALYDTINLSQPWNAPANVTALETPVGVYLCPGISGTDVTRPTSNVTGYFATVGPDRYLMPAGRSRRLSEIRDDPGQTLAVVEAPGAIAVPWMAPLDATDAMVLALGRGERPALPHGGGFHGAFADGSVRFLRSTSTEALRRQILTINGGESLSDDEL
jgi:prepilin-type processing-associated H-X9-DG protein